jgi:hypothetical protein
MPSQAKRRRRFGDERRDQRKAEHRYRERPRTPASRFATGSTGFFINRSHWGIPLGEAVPVLELAANVTK